MQTHTLVSKRNKSEGIELVPTYAGVKTYYE
jgi:preprotein translocase subunit Sec61beta